MSLALPWSGYLDHLRSESARFLDVLEACDPRARVPSCPDWDAGDLLWHLATVQDFWRHVIVGRPAGPDEWQEPERPPTHEAVASYFREAHEGLVSALAGADPDEPAWSWSSGPGDQCVGFTYRRQAHEALIHRVDAELAAGVRSPLPTALAADGVLEVLDKMYGGQPPWGRFDPLPHYVEYQISDVGASVWTQLGTFSGTSPEGTEYAEDPDQQVVPDPGVPADVVVRGPAAELDGWLWHRGLDGLHATDDADHAITVEGDPAVRDRLMAVLGQSLD